MLFVGKTSLDEIEVKISINGLLSAMLSLLFFY